MTVAELIALLQTMPQELPVTVLDGADYLRLRPEWVRAEMVEDAPYCVKSEDDGAVEDAEGPHVRIG